MLRRGCLLGVGGLLVICFLACGLGYFVGLPKIQNNIADNFQDGIATVVATSVADANASPGQLIITERQLNEKLNADVENGDVATQITESGVSLELNYRDDRTDPIRYSALPTIDENGHLELTDVAASEGFMERLLPKDKFANAIEDGVNSVLDENNLMLADIELTDGELTLTTVQSS
ncbi:MAG: hypothetical protein ACJ789_13255 [Thermomicrobiales bacterium]